MITRSFIIVLIVCISSCSISNMLQQEPCSINYSVKYQETSVLIDRYVVYNGSLENKECVFLIDSSFHKNFIKEYLKHKPKTCFTKQDEIIIGDKKDPVIRLYDKDVIINGFFFDKKKIVYTIR